MNLVFIVCQRLRFLLLNLKKKKKHDHRNTEICCELENNYFLKYLRLPSKRRDRNLHFQSYCVPLQVNKYAQIYSREH